MKTTSMKELMCAMAALVAAGGVWAADVTWDGGGRDGKWSTAANWDTDAVPTTNDRAILPSVTSGTRTVTQDTAAGTTANAIRFVQDNPDGISKLDLAGNLTLTKSTRESSTLNGTTSALQWDLSGNATRNQAILNLNGHSILLTGPAPSGAMTGGNLGGIVNFNEDGSSIYSTVAGHLTWNLFGEINASANGMIGKNAGTASNNTGNSNFNILTGASVNVTGGVFQWSVVGKRSQDRAMTVTNNGSINVSSGAALEASWRATNDSTNRAAITFTTSSSGALTQAGTLQFKPHRDSAGNSTSVTINNAGVWTVSGSNAVVRELITADHTATIVIPSFNVNTNGTLRGASAADALEFDEEGANGNRMTITNRGLIQPGAGSQGAGTKSVGTLALRDIHVTDDAGKIELDLGGTAAGQYDQLRLLTGNTDPAGAGTLDLSSGTGTLQLWKVNEFAPTSQFTITLIEAGSVSGTFGTVKLDEAAFTDNELDAGDGWKYQIGYTSDSVTLSYIPEPATMGLFLGAAALLALRRRIARG
jgi:hypothetical protein